MNTPASVQAKSGFQLLATEQLARGASVTFEVAAEHEAQQRAAGAAKRGVRATRNGAASAEVLLIEDSRGVLHWDYRVGTMSSGAPSLRRTALGGRGRYRGGLFSFGRTITRSEVAEVGPNAIGAALQKLDEKLTPNQGLRLFSEATLGDPVKPAGQLNECKRLLLLVHGTFSKGDVYFEALPPSFFASALAKVYSHVVSFDHPTLSVSPILNAMDLENTLSAAGLPLATPVDVICHSRGGLVASWWIRSTRYTVETLVAAGAPLSGTSLASPYRIRHLLDYFANYAQMLSNGLQTSAAFPTFASGFLAGAGGLVGILGGISGTLSALPVADAAIALVPGLNGQSRVTNNAELRRLWDDPRWTAASGNPACYVLSSDYEPKRDEPWWNIVAQLRQLPWIAANGVTDRLFPSGNDLVVDTESMSHRRWEPTDTLSYARTDGVHHCAYFTQPMTVAKLRSWLKIP
ncbi:MULTISPECIES: triacylglycerol lipase [unclassified Variovorax]|jgi:pimeloyl-ACP methyl ester carboxylesterase|uniref:esterase/lipase family protein n=1 Tax=unclassified Variovorax TaxID=663243 RepID=UPI0008AD88B6|nr:MULTISPECIES: alpha/beta fold hydrolase [unclassified Variovorax]SEJ50457.1 Alpha/beta hydrolase family protein [Variovorax sp. OK202]SFC52454.1 Alpha/beta hydrolase family protein [Variovorax sp. OK212]